MKYIFIFLVGGASYNLVEYLWRGYSHWTMTVDGGICLVGIYMICTYTDMNFIYKVMSGAMLITAVELASGLIINKLLKMIVWDYSDIPMNFMGQICLPYSLLWVALCIPLMAIIELVVNHSG